MSTKMPRHVEANDTENRLSVYNNDRCGNAIMMTGAVSEKNIFNVGPLAIQKVWCNSTTKMRSQAAGIDAELENQNPHQRDVVAKFDTFIFPHFQQPQQ